ncbi:MAG: hypothetical protein Q7R30_17890 [Acidobacteriota bacterium]|nr:hypothetical protein [Acidobacteriota bacterium]
MIDSTRWFESGPDLIRRDPALATLIVRVGMASNALNAQLMAGVNAAANNPGERFRNVMGALVTTAAVTTEAVRLAREELKVLRPLAIATGVPPEVLEGVKQLCAGTHRASPILARARNQIGFHWDADVIQPVVEDFGKNESIIWVESNADDAPIHRLALDVLALALLPPEVAKQPDEAATQRAIAVALDDVSSAMRFITQFFTAAIYGYLRQSGATRRDRKLSWFLRVSAWFQRLWRRWFCERE